jgi:voltage-gated potassium channel Kch
MDYRVHSAREDVCLEKKHGSNWGRVITRFLNDNKVIILFVLGVISILLGTIGFWRYFSLNNEPKSIATALYDALWLFSIEAGNLPRPIPWELEVSRWLSPALSMYAIILGVAAIFRNQVKELGLFLRRDHVIICGLGRTGLRLAQSFLEDNYSVVVIEKDPANENIAGCRELGAVVLTGDASDEYLLSRAGVQKAAYLVIVCGEDGVNSEIGLIARRLAKQRKAGHLNCAMQVLDPALWTLVRKQEFLIEETSNFRLHIFNLYDQGARQLFREFPITGKASRDCVPPMLVIIGAGNLAEQVILNAAREWSSCYHINPRPMQISLHDPEAETFIRRVENAYSLVSTVCEIHPFKLDPQYTQPLGLDFSSRSGDALDSSYIFVLVDNEMINLRIALSIMERVKPHAPRILVRMNEERGLVNLLREPGKDKQQVNNIQLFGLMEKTCKKEMIFNSTLEAISRAIHEEYLLKEVEKGNPIGSSPILVDWDCLPEEYKDMNREQADSIAAKLSAIGCGIAPWSDYGADDYIFTAAEIEKLAEMEHARWIEQKIRQGWTYGEKRDDQLKKHPSIVDYSDARLSESEKEKDRDTVREIPHFLALAGYQIVRL